MKAGILLRLGVRLVAVATVAACGGSSSTVSSSTRLRPALDGSGENLYNGIRGGTLTVEDSNDFQSLDPGQAYNSLDYEVVYATQRPLFSYLQIRPRRRRRTLRRGRRSSARTVRR